MNIKINKNKKLSFFIIGAPKCGTTTLYKWLSQHPNIFLPNNKEPCFFCDYKDNFKGPRASSFFSSIPTSSYEYDALFNNAGEGDIIGEASVPYLSDKNAPHRIKKYNPKAKIIVILRNPAQRAYSEYMHTIRDGYENVSFKESLELEEERKESNWIPNFFHITRGLYSENISTYINLFGKENVKIFLFEDIVTDPDKLISDVFEFIDIAPSPINTKTIYNATGLTRVRWLQKLLSGKKKWKDLIKKIIGKTTSQKIKFFVDSANLSKSKKLSKTVEIELIEKYFREDIIKLQELIGRDLSSWLSK